MGSGHLKPIFSLRLNSIPSPDFSVCWDLLGIKVLTGDEYSTIQGIARIFPEVRTIFQPPPPRPQFDRQKDSHWHNRALLCLLRRQAWVKIICSCFIPSCLLSVCIFKYIIKIQPKTNFLMWEIRVLFWKPIFGCGKNRQSVVSGKILQRIKQSSKELRQFILLLLFYFCTFFF